MTATSRYGLEKPSHGDYQDGWDVPLNDNADKIDAILHYLAESLRLAAGSQTNTTAPDFSIGALSVGSTDALSKRLALAMESDGSPRTPAEVTYARYSRLFDERQGLFDSLSYLEKMLRLSMQGYGDSSAGTLDRLLRAMKASVDRPTSSVLDTGITLALDGSIIPTAQPASADGAWLDIGGRRRRLRSAQASLTGALVASSQVAFVYAKASDNVLYSGNDGVSTKTGSRWNLFSSAAVGAWSNAKAGDILRISSNTTYGFDLLGDYEIISVVGPTLTILGGLPIPSTVTSVAGLTFQVIDIYGVTVHHDVGATTGGIYANAAPTPSLGVGESLSDRVYLGEIHYNGVAMVSQFAYRKEGMYDSGWQAAPVIAAGLPATITGINHQVGLGLHGRLGTTGMQAWPLHVRLYVAQKDAGGAIYDVQEVPFRADMGGATAPAAGSFGWFGYVHRQSAEIRFGAKLPTGADYAYMRKADAASFPNDAGSNASYQADNAFAVYRLIVGRATRQA